MTVACYVYFLSDFVIPVPQFQELLVFPIVKFYMEILPAIKTLMSFSRLSYLFLVFPIVKFYMETLPAIKTLMSFSRLSYLVGNFLVVLSNTEAESFEM